MGWQMSKEIFTEIYQSNYWGGKESRSGIGSDTDQTKFLVTELSLLLKKLKVRSMLDIPCGDFNWMHKVEFDGFYIGADIVEPLIERNRELYNDPLREFTVLNIVEDKLPKVDLVFSRDCLVHLSNEEVFAALANIKASGSKYLLTTNYFWHQRPHNNNIKTGSWRRLNLHEGPFNLPFPKEILVEGYDWDDDRDKSLCLWPLEDLK
jgi:SAM-dependent methyltransferase